MPQTIQVIDLFSGCGGMSWGFKRADTDSVSYEVLGGLDIDEHANSTYERMIEEPAIQAPVESLLTESGLQEAKEVWGFDRNEPLILIGCAPCQGFSSHGKGREGKDERNSLIEVFGKVAKKIGPDILIMENVPELLCSGTWEYYEKWHNIMTEEGYSVRARIYNLAQFGVPQERFRALVVASRDWDHFRMPSPQYRPSEYRTVRDAIEDLPPLSAGESDPDDPMHEASNHREQTVELIKHIPPDGGSNRALPPGMGPKCIQRVDGYRDIYGRMEWDKPANSITARCRTPSTGRFVHPEQHRGLTAREAALLQGFPSDFVFSGPFDERYRQIGNAVSPTFSKHIAEFLSEEWTRDHGKEVDESTDITEPIEKSISSSLASIKKKMREEDTTEFDLSEYIQS